jgi:hypothetical protein
MQIVYQRRYRAKLVERGLTCRATERKSETKPPALSESKRQLQLRRKRALSHARTEAFRNLGLTSLGTPRKTEAFWILPKSLKGNARKAARQKIYYARMRAAGIAIGGKRRGQKRIKRELNTGVPALGNTNREYQRRRYRLIAAENLAKGLTVAGKIRRDGKGPTAIELEWRKFRAEMEQAA